MANLTLVGTTLYGTASAGGAGGSGTLFSIDIGGGSFQNLYNFSSVNPANGTNTDGASPSGDLLVYANSLYGTAAAGGSDSAGVVFSLPLPRLPATISGIVLNLDGSAGLSFLGSPGSTNVIQSTTDLGSGIWQNISTNVADPFSGSWQWTDPNAGLYPTLYYRTFSR